MKSALICMKLQTLTFLWLPTMILCSSMNPHLPAPYSPTRDGDEAGFFLAPPSPKYDERKRSLAPGECVQQISDWLEFLYDYFGVCAH